MPSRVLVGNSLNGYSHLITFASAVGSSLDICGPQGDGHECATLTVHFYGRYEYSGASVIGCIQKSHRNKHGEPCLHGHLPVLCGWLKVCYELAADAEEMRWECLLNAWFTWKPENSYNFTSIRLNNPLTNSFTSELHNILPTTVINTLTITLN